MEALADVFHSLFAVGFAFFADFFAVLELVLARVFAACFWVFVGHRCGYVRR